jgi:hypothetical protein
MIHDQPLTTKELEDLGSQLTQTQQQQEQEDPARSIETRNIQRLGNTILLTENVTRWFNAVLQP